MRADSHACVAHATVRAHEVTRHAAYAHPGGQVFALAEAKGLPRLWHMGLSASLAGFADGLASPEAAAAESVAARLEEALRSARRQLRQVHGQLVERLLPDAAFLAVDLSGSSVEILGCGDARVYVHRDGETQRLTPRERPKDALLRGTPFRSRLELRPRDVILAGTESSFSQLAVGRVASVLTESPDTPVSVLSELLTEPAREAGVGAVAVVMRVL